VSAPGGVELDEDILGVVQDDFLEGLADDDLDGLVIGGGDLFGLEGGLDGSALDILDELEQVSDGVFALQAVFLDVFVGEGNHHELGFCVDVDAQELGESGSQPLGYLAVTHEHLALQLGTGLFEDLLQWGCLAGIVAVEQEDALLAVGEDDLRGLLVEEHDGLNAVGLDELLQVLCAELGGELVPELVEVFEESDLAGLQLFLDRRVEAVGELDVFEVAGHLQEGVVVLVLGAEVDHHGALALFGEDLGFGGHLHGRGSELLGEPGDDGRLGPAAVVLAVLAVLEELQRREALDAELLAQVLVHRGVHLAQHRVDVGVLQRLRGLGVLGRQGFAVPAPRGVELDQRVGVLRQEMVEVVRSQHVYTFLALDAMAVAQT